jgi:hypothetical protein
MAYFYSGSFGTDGKTFTLPLADCPAAGCTGDGAIAWASTNPADQKVLADYAAALDQEAKRAAAVAGLVATGALAPELAAVLGAGKMVVGGAVSSGFDAAGQAYKIATDQQEEYRLAQTVIAAGTGAVFFPLSGSSMLGNAAIGGAMGGKIRC